jgi:hypothetical protein
MRDEDRFPDSTFTAGALDLSVACESDACAVVDEQTVSLDLADLVPDTEGTERFSLSVRGNPGWLWLASTCPGDGLENALDVTIRFDRDCHDTIVEEFSGTLREVLLALSEGVRLGDDCLAPDETACVEFAWEFPAREDVEDYEGTAAAFELHFAAIQCRHNDGSISPITAPPCEDATTAAHGISDVEIWGCVGDDSACDCQRLGKLELSDAYATRCGDARTDGISENRVEPGVYDLLGDDDCVDTGYDVRVTETRVDGGETTALAFELRDEHGDPGPDLCRVVVKSGQERVTYDAPDLAPPSPSTEGLLAGSAR